MCNLRTELSLCLRSVRFKSIFCDSLSSSCRVFLSLCNISTWLLSDIYNLCHSDSFMLKQTVNVFVLKCGGWRGSLDKTDEWCHPCSDVRLKVQIRDSVKPVSIYNWFDSRVKANGSTSHRLEWLSWDKASVRFSILFCANSIHLIQQCVNRCLIYTSILEQKYHLTLNIH